MPTYNTSEIRLSKGDKKSEQRVEIYAYEEFFNCNFCMNLKLVYDNVLKAF